MKTIKLLAAGLLVASASTVAFGYGNPATHVNITGSTAFRAAANAAIVASFDSNLKYTYVGGSLGSANKGYFQGTINGHTVVVKTSFAGSVGGVKAIATNTAPLNAAYIPDAAGSAAATAAGAANYGGATNSVELADLAMSDASPVEAPFDVPGTISATPVGIIVFKMVAAKGSNTNLTNITGLQFQALASSSTGIPLSYFTGLSANTSRVYLTGRDDDSGTRLVAFAETAFGVTSLPKQFRLLPSNDQTATPTGIEIWPSVNGHPLGYWGFSGGGNVRDELKRDVSAIGIAGLIGYISEADAAGALTAGARELQYNGQTFSAANIQEGKYTFWGYENVAIDSQANADAQEVANRLIAAIPVDGFAEANNVGISLGRMHVGRSASGAVVTEGNPF